MKNRHRKKLYFIMLILISVITSLALVEIFLRIIVLHHFEIAGSWRFRDPAIYGDYFSDDDYWKLRHKLGDKYKPPEHPHPLLGWVGNFDSESYNHNDDEGIACRTPVLLYGDSFAQCATEICFQHLLNGDEEFAKNYYLLNYGVSGYGVDQIKLLYDRSKILYKNSIVIISLLTEDLDRSILSFRAGQKPFYTLKNNSLVLNGVPINPDTEQFLKDNPITIRSYLWRYISSNRIMPDCLKKYLRGDDEKSEKKKLINKAIIQSMIDDLHNRKVPFFFIVFHANWPDPINGPDSWRDLYIRELLDINNVPYISTKEIILIDAKKTGNDISEYFLEGGSHYNDYSNSLIATEIKKMILNIVKSPPKKLNHCNESSLRNNK